MKIGFQDGCLELNKLYDKWFKDHVSFDKIMVYLKNNLENEQVIDASEVVLDCINICLESFLSMLENGPYADVHNFVLGATGTGKIDLRNASKADVESFIGQATELICLKNIDNYRKSHNKEAVDFLKSHSFMYIGLLDLTTIILFRNNFPRKEDVSWNFLQLFNSIFFQFQLILDFIESESSLKLIHSDISARGQNKRWETTRQLNQKAVNLIYKAWANGDKRLHDEIARDIVSEINDPIMKPYREVLCKKYSNKDFDYKEKKYYNSELSKLTRGKVASVQKVMEMILVHAREIGFANEGKGKESIFRDSYSGLQDDFSISEDYED
ncbi:MAG: hypothetical protein AAGU21_11870 [Solidesulfovibrio sp.]|uniref:hypothetical protein n=1 Tax=Solidesulfovibrio sp. TaxID=2910990 RepID=UPI0031586B0B